VIGPCLLNPRALNDIAELEAYVAIRQVKARYCRTLDTKDWAGYADVFRSIRPRSSSRVTRRTSSGQCMIGLFGSGPEAKMGHVGHTGYGHYHERYVRQNGRRRIAAQRLTRLHVDHHYEPTGDTVWRETP